MVFLFGAASFLGAALLFLVEPMLAKLVLPSFGGSPMVWNTCTLFFQAVLLAGYVYVHLSTRRLGSRRQPWIHLALLVAPLLALPVALPADTAPPADGEPALWLLRVLALAAGLPFAILATTGPLLQRWFSWTGHARSEDPYFLYAASNAGSVVGLLGYPFLVEPLVGLGEQARWWSWAYAGFTVLVIGCGVVSGLAARRGPGPAATPAPARSVTAERPTTGTRLGWVALAFIPSSLMLGVTTHVSTDIAAIPLFWTVPLAVYLATFVVAFGRSSRRPPRAAALVASALVIPLLLVLAGAWDVPIWASVTLDVAVLAATGFAAHGRLAARRPSTEHLTTFYLYLSLGGALGGLLNGLLAPVVFDRPWEYPIVLGLVPLIAISARPRVSWQLAREPLVAVTCLLLVAYVGSELLEKNVVYRDRTFFGTYRVLDTPERFLLAHGTTFHGWEEKSPDWQGEPTAYFSRSGPVGDVMRVYGETGLLDRMAVVGMGAGTMALYGRPGGQFDFYEIDPAVVEIGRDSGYFDFVSRSAADVRFVVGDGRLELERVPDGTYGLIAIDAFSSDAIPAHLLTEEALAMYRRKLAPRGVLALHVTNRHLDLAPVVAAQADRLGMVGLERYDRAARAPASASHWLVLARTWGDLTPLRGQPGWRRLTATGVRAWTDDYSSLVQVLNVR